MFQSFVSGDVGLPVCLIESDAANMPKPDSGTVQLWQINRVAAREAVTRGLRSILLWNSMRQACPWCIKQVSGNY